MVRRTEPQNDLAAKGAADAFKEGDLLVVSAAYEGRESSRRFCWSDATVAPHQMLRLTVASNSSGLNGLTIQPLAPASLPRFLLSALDSVVNTRIGMAW